MFDPGQVGYPLRRDIDKRTLGKLLNHFESEVRRDIDRKLAIKLREELLGEPPSISKDSFKRLARWCKTDGIYGEGMDVARKISGVVFGKVLDRDKVESMLGA